MKKNILLAACFGISLFASAQNDTLTHEREITLAEAIALARTQSVDAAVALNELKTAYWEYRTFRADLLPEINFTGTLPNYNKSTAPIRTRTVPIALYVTIHWGCPVHFPLTRTFGSQAVSCRWLLLSITSSSWAPVATNSLCPCP